MCMVGARKNQEAPLRLGLEALQNERTNSTRAIFCGSARFGDNRTTSTTNLAADLSFIQPPPRQVIIHNVYR